MILDFFTDPILRAPTLGSMLMCFASSLIGVIVFIRKRSLLGEALSHASYPGVVVSVLIVSFLFPFSEEKIAIGILVGAFLSALAGLWVIDQMERRLAVKNDAALCFVLSIFFGIGILIASRIQMTHTLWYKQAQLFLYGQTATMTDIHIVIYGSLALLTLLFILFLYHPIEAVNFDRDFSKTIGIRVSWVDSALFLLLILAIVIGIRSVGVVLMAGMLIAPAVAARQLTHRLSLMFVFAALVGIVSGFMGNYLSLGIPEWMGLLEKGDKLSLPPGPMILLSAGTICLLIILFSPRNGLVSRAIRSIHFRTTCRDENIFKMLWRKGALSLKEIERLQRGPLLRVALLRLTMGGYLIKENNTRYALTEKGKERGERIVHLHRLWESYLIHDMGQGVEKVQRTAAEMEKILAAKEKPCS